MQVVQFGIGQRQRIVERDGARLNLAIFPGVGFGYLTSARRVFAIASNAVIVRPFMGNAAIGCVRGGALLAVYFDGGGSLRENATPLLSGVGIHSENTRIPAMSHPTLSRLLL